MKYADARPLIQSGAVIAWSHRKIRSLYDFKVMLVRLFTMSEYCHVGIVLVMGGRVWVLEAVTPRVRLVPLSNLLPCYHLTGLGMTDEQVEAGLALVGKDGVEYSRGDAVKAYFGYNNRADGDISCAEFVNTILDLPCLDTPSATVDFMLQNSSTLTEIQP